ncbi:MAG: hypothetical protein ACFE9R_17000, partial [Candidatus Hermodarchaeota archaeon]
MNKEKPENNLKSNYINEDRPTTWLNFTDVGDFTDWYDTLYSGYPFDGFDDTGDHLYLYSTGISSDKAQRNLDGFVVSDIIYFNLNISVKMYNPSPGTTCTYIIEYYTTDGYWEWIDYKTYVDTGILWVNKTVSFTPTKYFTKSLDFLRISLMAPDSGTYIKFYLWDENYKIYLPLIENFSVSPAPETQAIECGEPVQFRVNIFPVHPYFTDMIVMVKYIDTDITIGYDLQYEPFDPVQKYKFINFNITGDYVAQIRVTWLSAYYYSNIIAFSVYPLGEGYPQTSYLSLWSPFDDLSLTGSLKTYLGVDESYKICDFKDEYGYGTNLTWRPIYPAYSNQPLYSVTNTRLYLLCYGTEYGFSSGNGVEANLADTINITYYDSLKFSLKVKNTSNFNLTSSKVLYIIQNPSAWTSDYRLNLSAYTAYLNQWVTFIIPFNLFTYIYYSEALNELGFYSPASSGLLDIEIRDIYACNYNTLHKIINATGTTVSTNETIIRPDLPPLSYTFENTTSQTWNSTTYEVNETGIFSNFTKYHSSSYGTTYDYNYVASENATGHYQGYYTFRSDADDSVPAGWTETSDSGCWARINSTIHNHNKVLNLTDTSGAGHPFIYNQFSAKTKGEIEMWVYTDTPNIQSQIWITEDLAGSKGINLGFCGGTANKFQYYITGWNTITDLTSAWYHLRFVFKIGSGWYIYINQTRFPTSGYYNFRGSPANIQYVIFTSYSPEVGQRAYFDSVDYNWTTYYYTNRVQNLETEHNNEFTNYQSIEIDLNSTVLINDITLSSYSQPYSMLFFQIYDYNIPNWVTYTSAIGTYQNKLQFAFAFFTMCYQNSFVYNFTVNYTKYVNNLSITLVSEFTIPPQSLINFTFTTAVVSNITVDSKLYMYNFSSNSYIFLSNITNVTQIITFSNNSDFFSTNRLFQWKINGSYIQYLGSFSVTQINYTINYTRYQFDRQVCLSTVNITSYSNDLYGFTFESDFTSNNALTRLYFANLTSYFFQAQNFTK